MSNLQKEVEAHFPRLTYGKDIDSELQIQRHMPSGFLIFDPFYRHDGTAKIGVCSELQVTAFLHLSRKLPHFYFTRVVGSDERYFREVKNGQHTYLLASELPLFHGNETEDSAEIRTALEKNPLLIDPCFGIVTPWKGSGYRAKLLTGQHHVRKYASFDPLLPGESTPIGISGTSLISLEAPLYPDMPLKIHARAITGEHSDPYLITSTNLDGWIDELPRKAIQRIRATPIQTIDELPSRPLRYDFIAAGL